MHSLSRTATLAFAAALLWSGSAWGADPSPTPADVLAWLDKLQQRAAAIDSYTTTVVIRERIDGKLGDHRFIFLKFRRVPKSFYMYFLGPAYLRGQQVLYVATENDGKMLVRSATGCGFGPFPIHPESVLATRGLLCPVHKLNLHDLARQAHEYLQAHTAAGTFQVRHIAGAKIDGRPCTVYEVDHQGSEERFLLRLFADDEQQLLCRFELHSGRATAEKLELLQEYTFQGEPPIAMEKPLADRDFFARNPDYGFYPIRTHDDAIREKYEAERAQQPATDDAERRSQGGRNNNDGVQQQQVEAESPAEKSSSSCYCRRRGRLRR